MRYQKRTDKNIAGRTRTIEIIDTDTNAVVQRWDVPTSGSDRKQQVGIANRAADAELVRLNTENQTSDVTGETYGSEEELREAERMVGLESNYEDFEARIKESGRLREVLAANKSARQQGQLMSQLERAILGSGGDQGQVEALIPQVQEGSQRNLQDYITGSQATTEQELAQFIPTKITSDLNQARLQDAMSQFLMNEDTERARFQAQLDSQPEWWENLLSETLQNAGQLAVTAIAQGGA